MNTWFITGASRGFGALIVEKALAQGDQVVASARDPKAIIDRFGEQPKLLAVALDVTNEAQAQQAVTDAISLLNGVVPNGLLTAGCPAFSVVVSL